MGIEHLESEPRDMLMISIVIDDRKESGDQIKKTKKLLTLNQISAER